jgi:hypothetical protein
MLPARRRRLLHGLLINLLAESSGFSECIKGLAREPVDELVQKVKVMRKDFA